MEEEKMKNIKININDYLQTKETTFITLSGSRYAEIEDAIIETTNEKWKSKVKKKTEELEAMSISKDIYYDDIKRLFQELLED